MSSSIQSESEGVVEDRRELVDGKRCLNGCDVCCGCGTDLGTRIERGLINLLA